MDMIKSVVRLGIVGGILSTMIRGVSASKTDYTFSFILDWFADVGGGFIIDFIQSIKPLFIVLVLFVFIGLIFKVLKSVGVL